jgi:hypothetical protein
MQDIGIPKIDRLIFALLNIILIVDAINGFFINSLNHLPIAQLYKLTLITFFLIRLFQQKKVILIFGSLIYIIFFVIFYIIETDGVLILETLIHLSKFYFTFLSFFYFKNILNKNSPAYFKLIKNVFYINFFVLVVSIVLGNFGYGFSSYENEGVGSKGYFGGANDLGACLFIIFSFIYFQLFYNKVSIIYKSLVSILLLIVSILLSTKLAILSTLMSFYYISKMFKDNLDNSFIYKIFQIIRKSIILVFLTILIIYGVKSVGILDKWSNNFELSTDGIIYLLTSGRSVYFELKFADYLNSNFLQILFGMGGDRTAELDFLDSLMNYGIIGSILVYSFLIKLYFNAKKFKSYTHYPYAVLVLYINIVLAIVSFIAGHVIFSAMAGIFISLINSLVFVKMNKSNG